MQIKVFMDVSQLTHQGTVSLEDLNLTEEKWNEMSEDERKESLQEFIDDLPSQPYWILTKFNIL